MGGHLQGWRPGARRVVSCDLHSYEIETLEGYPITGKFSPRRLRLLVPRKDTELESMQAKIEKEWRRREEVDDEVKDAEEGWFRLGGIGNSSGSFGDPTGCQR